MIKKRKNDKKRKRVGYMTHAFISAEPESMLHNNSTILNISINISILSSHLLPYSAKNYIHPYISSYIVIGST
jgi:hypothetical protein